MFKIIRRTDITSWSARIMVAEHEYIEHCRYPVRLVRDTLKGREDVRRDFLQLVYATRRFADYEKSMSVGVRKRRESLYCPIPPLQTQDELLGSYRAMLAVAKGRQDEVRDVRRDLNEKVHEFLRIFRAPPRMFDVFFLIARKELSTWSARGISTYKKYQCGYPLKELSSVLKFNMNTFKGRPLARAELPESTKNALVLLPQDIGCGFACVKDRLLEASPTGRVINVPDGAVLFFRMRPEQTRYWINDGSLGKSVYAKSGEFSVFILDERVIDEDYFRIVLATDFLRDQFRKMSAGRTLPRINHRQLQSIRLPLPSLPEQRQVVEYAMPLYHHMVDMLNSEQKFAAKIIDRIEAVLYYED